MKLKLTISVFALAMLFSCQKDKKVTEVSTLKVENSVTKNLNVQTFSVLPELGDCSTYIAESQDDFEARKFIFADDYGNNAYLKINDEMLHIPLEEGDFDPSDLEREIHLDNGKIIIKGQLIPQEDNEEEIRFQGEIIIEQNGETFTSSIYGKSSC